MLWKASVAVFFTVVEHGSSVCLTGHFMVEFNWVLILCTRTQDADVELNRIFSVLFFFPTIIATVTDLVLQMITE